MGSQADERQTRNAALNRSGRIPTNLITGFLGSGKTTTILSLLKRKPPEEHWAVLVNEFGQVGIDGTLLQSEGATIREVAGGCLCCVAGVPMQVGLNVLISRVRPDRLLIEPTGLGHPARVLALLESSSYRELIDLRATICVVDPRKLTDARYLSHASFQDQARLADVILANKVDCCEDEDRRRFLTWGQGFDPAKAELGWASYGEMPLAWLDIPRDQPRRAIAPLAHASLARQTAPGLPLLDLTSGAGRLAEGELRLAEGELWRRLTGRGEGMESCGWIIQPHMVFDSSRLLDWCQGASVERLKGVVHTEQGWLMLNGADGVLTQGAAPENIDSRIEVLAAGTAPWDELEVGLFECRLDGSETLAE